MRMPLQCLVLLLVSSAAGLIGAASCLASPATGCGTGAGTAAETVPGRPTNKLSWRAKLLKPADAYSKLSQIGTPCHGSPSQSERSCLLVLAAVRDYAGVARRRIRVVIKAPTKPTSTGLFAIIGVWSSSPDAFLGSWILVLTVHSDVLHRFDGCDHRFDGGDGRIGIHGRGGASLLNSLGSAHSHGCVRLANTAIDWLVSTVGLTQLSGISVQIN